MMLISELSFPHLQAEREAQLTRELERRRVALERLEEPAPRVRSARGARQSRVVSRERMPRAARESSGTTLASPAC
jgi:hypothetical protein